MKIGNYRIRLKKSCADLFIPVLFAVILAYYMISAINIMDTNAMLMIRGVAVLMIISLVFIIKEELIIQKADDCPAEEKKPFFSSTEECIKFVGFTALATFYFITLPYLGFIISTVIYSFVTMYFLGVRNIKVLILLPIILTACTHIMFRMLLLVPLPVGVFGI